MNSSHQIISYVKLRVFVVFSLFLVSSKTGITVAHMIIQYFFMNM